ncbi:MAG: hypothetical protein A4E45_01476 [Methanosaeta sp. PtaB.Bin039]|nr:MAG: hypothetical protein A4E45_01476 [Methanosaeta sp. PtaB.Bin039]OPY44252.1 MAG: hypothetical protein A4E47_01671 [Methanosaeta sp. PtaU1.Bin028]HQF17599.1 DUF2116 family Zn-ribbon domain-containing protein [Methanotrichaceae archaeon]HQI92203.1 DUF2116 family Zn-ribbon domain-containing protein [Methanotrichaceae archaeon]HQJ29358.1 DUF2116 family Zn-ribbon domain-containing protein [Methanotrichaceae archaeon]
MNKIPSHRHCLVCGKMVDVDEDNFCDELCRAKYRSAQKRQQMLFFVFLVLMVLIIFIPSFIGQPKV